ncbi:MAG: hypothetical protein HQK99_17510 [Nitrospirae bacterium]|nr:hypothetical protein [Nitrospirota bacterium]
MTGLTTTPELINNKSKLAQKVVCGLQDALDFTRNDTKTALSILSNRFPEIKIEVAKEALERVLHENIVPKTTKIDAEAWSKAIRLRKEVGDIKDVQEMPVYVDNSFANKTTQCKEFR